MYQQTTLIGNLGNDPEMRFTPGGKQVTSFSLATSKKWTGANGDKQEKTTWWRVSVWDKAAEAAANYLKKGRQVMVVGEVEARGYTNKAGEVSASLEIIAREIKFLGTNGGGEMTATAVAEPVEDTSVPF